MTFLNTQARTLTAVTLAVIGSLSLGSPAFAGDANSPLMMLNTLVQATTQGAAPQAPIHQNAGAASQAQIIAAEAQALNAMTPQQRAEYLARKHGANVNDVVSLTNAMGTQPAAVPQVQAAPQNGLAQALSAVAGQALQNQNVGGSAAQASAGIAQAQAATAEAQAIANMTPEQRAEYLARKHGGQGWGNAVALTNALRNQGAAPAPQPGYAPAAQQPLVAPAALLNGLLGAATGSNAPVQNR